MESCAITQISAENAIEESVLHDGQNNSREGSSDSSSSTLESNDAAIGEINAQNETVAILETVDISPEKCGGAMKQILKNGVGIEFPCYGDKVYVHYIGWWLNNDKKPVMFENSYERDKFEFLIGKGNVIKGWDIGIATMKKDEVALFILQPQYAYGALGNPPTVPPHSTVIFEIKLYDWKMEDLTLKKDEGILRKILYKGDGSSFPNEGASVSVYLVGYCNEAVFEERKVSFTLGEGCNSNVPEGIELALLKFRLNERSMIHLKSDYIFENMGLPHHNIPPDHDLKYEVTLISFSKVKEVWEMNSDEKLQNAKLAREKGVSYTNKQNFRMALKQFKLVTTYLENEPGVELDDRESRNALLLSGYLNSALCQLKLQNDIEAIKSCDKALEIDPHNEKALFRRGQARMGINDCEEALEDLNKLCLINPVNKAAKNSVVLCQEKIRKQKLKDKSLYNNMFDKFVKQDEEKLRNVKTETGVWDERTERYRHLYSSETQKLIESNDSALRDGNVIELPTSAHL